MYKIYLNDNNNIKVKKIFNILRETLEEKYIICRNEEEMNEEDIIEESNYEKPNIHLSINISNDNKNNVYYNKNNSYSFLLYNLIKKECKYNYIDLIYNINKKKEIVDIIVPCLCIEFDRDKIKEEKLVRILENVIKDYFEQEVI